MFEDTPVSVVPGHGVGLAVAQDMGGGLMVPAALAALPVSALNPDAALERQDAQAGAMDEAPVAKPGEGRGRGVSAGGVVDLALVFLGEELQVVSVLDSSPRVTGSTPSGAPRSCC